MKPIWHWRLITFRKGFRESPTLFLKIWDGSGTVMFFLELDVETLLI